MANFLKNLDFWENLASHVIEYEPVVVVKSGNSDEGGSGDDDILVADPNPPPVPEVLVIEEDDDDGSLGNSGGSCSYVFKFIDGLLGVDPDVHQEDAGRSETPSLESETLATDTPLNTLWLSGSDFGLL